MCDTEAGTCLSEAELLYVIPKNGSTTSDCSSSTPCDFDHAVNIVSDTRSTLILSPGQYGIGGNQISIGACTHPITIIGYGSFVEGAIQGSHSAILEVNVGCDVTVKGMKLIQDFPDPGTLTIECSGSKNATTRLSLVDVQAQGDFDAEACDAKLQNVTVDTFAQSMGKASIVNSKIGLVSANVTPLKFSARNSLIGSLGVSASTAAVDVSFCTIPHRFAVPAGQTGVVITNSVIGADGQADAIVCPAPCLVNATNNLLSSQSNAIADNFVGDPRFVNPATDFHLTAGSPAIDKASEAGPPTDVDGAPRPVGAAADLGAYEFVP